MCGHSGQRGAGWGLRKVGEGMGWRETQGAQILRLGSWSDEKEGGGLGSLWLLCWLGLSLKWQI